MNSIITTQGNDWGTYHFGGKQVSIGRPDDRNYISRTPLGGEPGKAAKKGDRRQRRFAGRMICCNISFDPHQQRKCSFRLIKSGSDTGRSALPSCGLSAVLEYPLEFHAHPAEELALLPGRLTITKMLSDYAVIRDKARMCSSFTATKTAFFRRWPYIYPKERQKSWKLD